MLAFDASRRVHSRARDFDECDGRAINILYDLIRQFSSLFSRDGIDDLTPID